jgi:peptidoglycan/LPS O-acetylase OafA/YrhL
MAGWERMQSGSGGDTGKIAFLDILRGIAPLLVLWAHLGGWWLGARGQSSPLQTAWIDKVAAPLHLWQDGGHLGVLIFFLVSGFIISHVSLRESGPEFAIKRVFRVLPMFWIALTLIAVFAVLTPRLGLPMVLGPQEGSLDFVGSATFWNWFVGQPNMLSISWTLFIELLFYGIIFLLMPISRHNPMTGSWLALIIALAVYMYTLRMPQFTPFLWAWMYMPFLLVGRAFYLAWAKLASTAQAAFYGLAAYGAFLLMYTSIAHGRLLSPGDESLVSQLIAIVGFGVLCFSNVRNFPPFRFCADISYSLYVLHAPVGSFMLDYLTTIVGLRYEMAIGIVIAALLALSWLTFTLLERPFQWIGRTLIKTFRLGMQRPASAPAAAQPAAT